MKNAIKFFKYDLRKGKMVLVLSIVLCAPISLAMGQNDENVYSIFTYMSLIAMIAPLSLFSYEQKSGCSFDNMLPAKEIERVSGRFLTGVFYIILEMLIATILSAIMIKTWGKSFHELGVVIMLSAGVPFIYNSIMNTIMYAMGTSGNPQLKRVVMIFPTMVIWGVLNAFSDVLLQGENIENIVMLVSKHLNSIAAIVLIIGIVMYIGGIMLSTYIVKRKDY